MGVGDYRRSSADARHRGQADAAQQLRVIEDLVAKNVTALAVVPFDTAALEPVLKKAMDKGIVVVTHEAENQKNTQNSLHEDPHPSRYRSGSLSATKIPQP